VKVSWLVRKRSDAVDEDALHEHTQTKHESLMMHICCFQECVVAYPKQCQAAQNHRGDLMVGVFMVEMPNGRNKDNGYASHHSICKKSKL
jgi:hypothetical protein